MRAFALSAAAFAGAALLTPVPAAAITVAAFTDDAVFNERCTADDLGAAGGGAARNCEWSVGEIRSGSGTVGGATYELAIQTPTGGSGGATVTTAEFAHGNGTAVPFTLSHTLTALESVVTLDYGGTLVTQSYARPYIEEMDTLYIRARAAQQESATRPDRRTNAVLSGMTLSSAGESVDLSAAITDSGLNADGELRNAPNSGAAAYLAVWGFDFSMAWTLTGFNAFDWFATGSNQTVAGNIPNGSNLNINFKLASSSQATRDDPRFEKIYSSVVPVPAAAPLLLAALGLLALRRRRAA